MGNLPEKVKGGKPQSKQALYSKASSYAPRAIERLAELMENRNPSVAVSAAKALLNKAIPDLKAMELSGDEKRPLLIISMDEFRKRSQSTGSTQLHDQTE